jgi:uncharacterized protein (TIGR02145 family)
VCVVHVSGIFKISRRSETKQNEKQNNMRKNILGFLFLLGSCIIQAQIGIGVPKPAASSVLELSSTSKGFLPPRLTTAQRDAIATPAVGLMIFNTTKNCLEWYNGTLWYNGCGDQDSGSISSINCAGSTPTGSLVHGYAASGVSSSIPYTGGNGGSHTGQVVASTGVTGLTATLTVGNFAVGTGSLTYTITGTPASSGTALFAVNIGGQSCSLSVVVAAGSIATINCAGSTPTGSLVHGYAASGVSSSIPYTGGNGGSHTGQVVASTGVTGLTATLTAGNFAVGTGSLNYTITGTAASSGTALFAVNIGGQSCTLSVAVAAGSIATLDCAGSTPTGSLVYGYAASGVSSSIPYTGGNGGSHTGQVVASTGVTGLMATLTAGNFAVGTGSLTYTITGTPASSGTASFAVNIGGKSCSFGRSVNCSAYVAPGVLKAFMCHNLGADDSLDPHVPVQGIHGDYYQWGKATSVATASTSAAAIGTWNTTAAANGSWLNASKTGNDPCPDGFRVPTSSQWAGVVAYNTVSITGSWTNSATNFTTAIHWGPNASTPTLTLPASGYRYTTDGALNYRGNFGYYWSSTENGASAYGKSFSGSNTYTNSSSRTFGFSVRCISE